MLLVIASITLVGCKQSNDMASNSIIDNDVTVTTYTPQDVTDCSAICGGNVTSNSNIMIIAKGVCWSVSQNPSVTDSHTNEGSGVGEFTSCLTNLNSQTIYYIRAYATTEVGTIYGDEKTISTEAPAPVGSIDGLFSVNHIRQVYFSKGNLQYQASTNTWRFAENQWDCMGDDNSNISNNSSCWIDMFGWGTSGYDHGAVCYQPWSTSISYSDYYAYGSSINNLYSLNGTADWGYNTITNGGNNKNVWRTPTREEWFYILKTRETSSGIRYAKANINGVNGLVLLPDNWNSDIYYLDGTNDFYASFNANSISQTDWIIKLEANGAVFLPAAGYRYSNKIDNVGVSGYYWSASHIDDYNAHLVYYNDEYLNTDYQHYRSLGLSVRLICLAEK